MFNFPSKICWRLLAFVPLQGMVMECREACHVPLNVLMVYPNQASSLQGSHCGNGDILAVNVSETGSGWRQSTQNGALLVPPSWWHSESEQDVVTPDKCHLHYSAFL